MATPVIMPKFGMAQEDATVIAWLYREGDRVERGAPILEVETDKTTMVVEAPATGVLRGLSAHPGDLVPVTQVIAYILEPGEALPAAEPPAPASEKPDRPPRLTPVARRMAAHEGLDLDRLEIPSGKRVISRRDIEQAIASREQMSPEGNSGAGRIRATPAARRLARAHGVDLADVPGRGPRGRVQAGDVLQAASPGPAGHAPPASRIEPLTGKRRTIAARMTRSYQEAPHITLTVEADMAAALEIIRAPGGQEGPTVTPVSVTAFLVKA